MSTRSLIGMQDEKGRIKCIYAHWDGYPSNNGRLLLEHWADKAKLAQLLALGDISVLGERIGKQIDFNRNITDESYSEQHEGQCVAYHRDRGEKWAIVRPHTVHSEERFLKLAWDHGCDYAYVLRADGVWAFARIASVRQGETQEPLAPLTAEVCAVGT